MIHSSQSSLFSGFSPRHRLAAASAVAASVILGGFVSAADTTYVWNGSTSTTNGSAVTYNWNTNGNWNVGLGGPVATTFPKAAANIAEFNGTVANSLANDVSYNVSSGTNQTIDQLYLSNITTSFNIKSGNAYPITLAASANALGSAAATKVGLYQDAASTKTSTITAPLVLGSNQTWEVDAGIVSIGNAVGTGGISSPTGFSYTLNKTGAGTLTFNNSNVTTGAITVSAGELELSGTTAHPNTSSFASPITLGADGTNASLILDSGTTLSSEVDLSSAALTGNYTLGNNSDSSTVTYAGTIRLGHAANFNAFVPATVVNVTGYVTGAQGIQKTGTGILNLTNTANDYAGGATTVKAGELRANNGFTAPGVANGSATGTSNVTITNTNSSSNATFGGNGGVSQNVTLAAGNITAGADDNTPGELAIGKTLAVTLAPGNGYNWKINDATGTKGATDGWDDVTAKSITFTTPDSPATAGPFTIHLQSLGGGAPGALSVAPTSPTTWTIAESTNGAITINGVAYKDNESLTGPSTASALAGLFAIDTSGFTLPGGIAPTADEFTLSLVHVAGTEDLQLTYNAVPEPTSLAVLGIAGLGLLRRRRQA